MKVEMLPVAEVSPYEKNPRRNEKAVDAVAASIRQFGWRQPIVVDAKKVIIVGHTRYLAALKLGEEKVPVLVAKDLKADQVKAYRIADNKTNEIAEWDVGLLSAELKALSDLGWNDFSGLAFDTREIDALLSPLAEKVFEADRPTLATATEEQAPELAPAVRGEEPRNYLEEEVEEDDEPQEPDTSQSITTYRDDAKFSSSNWLGFPDLLPHMLWDGDIRRVYIKDEDTAPTQLIVWSAVGVDERMRGHVVTFYASDERFEHAIWDKAVDFLDKMAIIKPGALVMPDFSTWTDEPTAFNIWNTFRARWCARYWQEAGHKIIPNVNLCDEASWEWIFLGYPKEVPCAMFQCRQGYNDNEKSKQTLIRGLHEWCKRVTTRKMFLYGGEHREWLEPHLPKGPQYVWFPSYHKARKDAGLF
jgi:ParB-like chromosome segregation protein Spo0J